MEARVKKIRYDRIFLFVIAALLVSYVCFFLLKKTVDVFKSNDIYAADSKYEIALYDETFNEVTKVVRGTKLKTLNGKLTNNEEVYQKVEYDKKEYFIKKNNSVDDIKKVVKEEKMYVRTPLTFYKNNTSIDILGLITKGEEVTILDYDALNSDGSVNSYKVKYNDQEGYIYGKYTVFTKEEALLNYDQDNTYQKHLKRTDAWGGGAAGNLDYYPYQKAKFENNVMPAEVRSLYMNAGVLGNIDKYIEIAKSSGINAFVVDIKDNTAPGYASKVMETYSITNYQKAINTFDNYQKAIKKLKDNGFYVIGRITVFKDSFFAKDHPEMAIKDTKTGGSFNHDGSYWPSAYHRYVWEFNVKLAIEAVQEMGFNEIQFDYVRFPDRIGSLEKQGLISFGNEYKEDKAQAIQRFLMYATDEIHKVGAYVSADVFGESAHTYVTAYGQYWPAISNVVDVISGMPYPDHFSTYEYGFKVPVWTIPYDLLNLWGKTFVMKRQEEIATPAVVRTWIQVYDAIKAPKIPYDTEKVADQIRGLYDAGLKGGFMTWSGSSSLTKYEAVKEAFGRKY